MSINTNSSTTILTPTSSIIPPTGEDTFTFPKTHSFPPFFTLQPTALTRQAQLAKWSSLIQSYCQHHRIYQLPVTATVSTSTTTASPATEALFSNSTLKKRLAEKDIKTVIDYMVSGEGDQRAEWTNAATKTSAWIWWRKPEEWGDLIARWVDETGQKGSVLTLFEIVEGEGTEQQEFHGMNMEVLHKSLNVLVKKGKAQIFGAEDQQGVKFF